MPPKKKPNNSKSGKKQAAPVTPTNAKKKPKTSNPKPAIKNPYASKKESKSRYVVYTLMSGEKRAFDNVLDSVEFSSDYESIITSCEHFETKAKMNAFIKCSTPTKTSEECIITDIDTKMSPEEKAKFNDMKAAIDFTKPMQEIHFNVKTSKKSNVAIIIIQGWRANGDKMWFIKQPFDKIISHYFKTSPTGNDFTDNLLTTLQLAKERDPDGQPNDQLFSERKSDGRKFYVNTMWGFVNIPVEEFASAEEEFSWFQDQATVTWNHVRTAQRSPLFNAVAKEFYSAKMWEKMNEKSDKGPTWTEFIQQCRVKVSAIDNLNKFVVLDEVKDMMMFLVKNELQEKKYPNDDTVITSNNTGITKVTPDKKENSNNNNTDEEEDPDHNSTSDGNNSDENEEENEESEDDEETNNTNDSDNDGSENDHESDNTPIQKIRRFNRKQLAGRN